MRQKLTVRYCETGLVLPFEKCSMFAGLSWRNCYGRTSVAAEAAYDRGRMLRFYDTTFKVARFIPVERQFEQRARGRFRLDRALAVAVLHFPATAGALSGQRKRTRSRRRISTDHVDSAGGLTFSRARAPRNPPRLVSASRCSHRSSSRRAPYPGPDGREPGAKGCRSFFAEAIPAAVCVNPARARS